MSERRTAAEGISVCFVLSMALFLPAVAAERLAVPADWQAQAQRQVAEAEYAIRWQEQPLVPTLAPSWHAPNRAQGFRTYFTESGPRVIPRTEEAPSWQWGLQLFGVGRDQTPIALVKRAPLAPQANRITYRRGSVEEWYINDARGLKQGFTLSHRPDGDKDPLRLTLLLEGNLSPRISADGQAIDFVTSEGARALRYAELLVTDATGEELPAHMEGWSAEGQRGIRLVIDDTNAVWPLTIDPLVTSPAWTAESDQAGATFGFSVGAAGDVNGDGYGDVIVGAPQFDNGQTDEGRAFVYHGSASGLSLTPNWTKEINQANAFYARAVGTAGDVNGDGYSDVIVSAPAYDNGQMDEGRAYVYYGSAAGLSASENWSAEGNQTNAQFSWSVGTAGDVNGDGYSDVIVGAQLYDNPQPDEGAAFVYYGSASGLSLTANWTAESNQASAQFGQSAGTAGDVNGDGYADVIVGASLFDNGQFDEGRAFVYYGSAAGLSATANWTAESNQASAQFGIASGTAGDVNGDGYADVIVGANGYDDPELTEGRAYVFYGSSTGLSPTAAWTAESDQAGAQFGITVGTAGDINGDGYADVVVGATTYDDGETDEGRGYVYYGSPTGLPPAPNWDVNGNQAGAGIAASIATAGDVNGDGYGDVIVGAPNFDNGQTDEGIAFVYNGGPDGLAMTAHWTVESDQGGAQYGYSVRTAGDVNGDGYADVIVGAPGFDNGQADEGRVFVYHGSPSGLSPTASWTAESNQTGAWFGQDVGTAGDVNGDGYADVIVGAPYFDNGQTDEGRAFVYQGSAAGLSATASWTAESDQAGAWFGSAVATAGDVNGDGYADVIVGAPQFDNGEADEGRAFVYLGSAAGLSGAASWTAESNQVGANFGAAVSTAGDVNGDGYSDVLVGSPRFDDPVITAFTDEGAAFVYHGSASGLSLAANWTKIGEPGGYQTNNEFGNSVGTAGDVNGDGYADVIVGAHLKESAVFNDPSAGAAFVHHGSASGLSLTADFAIRPGPGEGYQERGRSVGTAGDVNGDGYSDVIVGGWSHNPFGHVPGWADIIYGSAAGLLSRTSVSEDQGEDVRFAFAVGTAGDVNGDGYADVIVGAPWFDNPQPDEGRAFVYLGGAGPNLRPQQRRADDEAPLAPMGTSGTLDSARLGALGRTPFGRGRVKLEWEVKPFGTLFDGSGLQSSAGWLDTGTGGVALNELVTGLASASDYHWRVRLRYHPGTTPFQVRSRWFTTASNGWQEGDFRTSPWLIGDRVWEDMDGDGVRDAGELGVAGAVVALYNGAGTFLNAAVTDASGAYAFRNVSVGATYRLRFLPPSSHVLTLKDQGGDDLLDSDVDPITQFTPVFTFGNNQDLFRWDAGMIPICLPPDERIFIYTITQSTDGNHYPILNFQDPNQLSQITGYNVRRSSNRALPPATWPLVASDIIDMDQGTPNKQWVDSSGDVSPSGIWYYQVTAVNTRCPAEGPF